MGKPIADKFFGNVRANPDKVAVICENNRVTYGELGALVNRYANLLAAHGVRRGEHIGVPLLNDINSAALLMVACEMGIGLVPINPSTPIQFIKTTFASGDVKHMIAHRAFLKRVDAEGGIEIPGITICTDGTYPGTVPLCEIEAQSDARADFSDVTGDETLALIMTSGSTGSPKPIDLSQNCKRLRAEIHFKLYKLTGDDVILAATPLYHTLAVRLVMLPLQLGGTSVIMPRFTPALWLEQVRTHRATFTIAVSSQLSQVCDLLEREETGDISTLRCVVSSSAWLEPNVKERLVRRLNCEFHEIYGTSETASPTDIDFRESAGKLKSVGKCVPGAKIRIRRPDGTEADTGEAGEITTDTVQIFKGYYNRPDLTKQAFDGPYFRTGDLGYVDGDGYLYFSGRIKEIIVSGGINIYPQDIETTVLDMPGVRECAAFPHPDGKLGEAVALVVSPKAGTTLRKRDVVIYCARHLADFQQPRYIYIVDEIPKNNMGKITRLHLAQTLGRDEE